MSTVTTSSLEIANRLRPALLMLGRSLRREANDLGVTAGQASVLGTIKNHPALGLRELAAREGMSAPAMTRYIDRMQSAGLIERTRSTADGRRVELRVTERGVAALRSVRSRRTAWLASRLEQLTPAELAAVDAAIEPLLRLVGEDA